MCIAGRRNTFKGSHWANKSNLLEKWKPQKVKEENCCYATNWKVVGSTRGLAHVNGKFDSKNFHGISFEVPYAAHRRTTSSVGQSNSLTSADQKQLLKLECVGLGARSTYTHIHIDVWSYIYVQYIRPVRFPLTDWSLSWKFYASMPEKPSQDAIFASENLTVWSVAFS